MKRLTLLLVLILSTLDLMAHEVECHTYHYATADGQHLMLDLYSLPTDNSAPRPCMIFAFGGGFVMGERNHEYYARYFDTLAKSGIVVASIDYRLGLKNTPKNGGIKTMIGIMQHAVDIAVEDIYTATCFINGRLSISKDYKRARFTLSGTQGHQWYTFNSGMNICFLLATAGMDTIFIHASCVSYQGKAYLFLGKSGTGKSTHSRMWLNALEGVELMNDDHPIIRIGTDGQPVAFGSPWSGKTKCYKNVEAPIGGIIRIIRAPYNKARRLSVIESYASLISSCSGITWEKDLADGKDHSIQGIIAKVPCWVMECLPDNEAAVVCSQSVTQV